MTVLLMYGLYSLAIIHGLYQAHKKQDTLLFYTIVILFSLMITRSPFNVPGELIFSAWAFLGFGVLFYKSLNQKRDVSLIPFSLIFLVFGLVFLGLGLIRLNITDPVLRFFFARYC
jgi:hypothetical protein